ncbi:PREDICTED: HAUS augmin-like complex subunit 3 [Chaetura pelagica]|uniref:HAUS augmin-like complex subunit 3 n=1 Tax=Chaetura pelagica TaxID=8897 RepID=UPI000523CA93|nr:PREDICTED: HAUS augmin-like complex subunit 3 [Chaetura pelagica]
MSSHRQSHDFPLDTANKGAQLMATLRLVYPHADTLCEKDFDWLFDCPQTRQFLEWFCSTVTEEHVLTPAEVEAYEALLAAGKPILEGDALEQALQLCLQVPQLPSVVPDDEASSLEALQQELQELQDYRDRQLWRYNKLQVWVAKLQEQLRCLEEKDKVVKQDLKKAQIDLELEFFQMSAVLRQIIKDAKQLAEWYGDVGKGRPPALLCEMDLGPYMELEQQATDVFEKLNQEVLPGCVQASDAQGEKDKLESGTQMNLDQEIPERREAPYQECAKTPLGVVPVSQGTLVQDSMAELLVEGSNGRDMLSMEDEEERDGSKKATEKMDTKHKMVPESLGTDGDELLKDQDSVWKELSRIEKAHICAQREVIVMSAKVEGNCAALEWAQKTLEALEKNQQAARAELCSQAPLHQKQLHILRCSIVQILNHQLPPLLQAQARLSSLPVLQRKLSLEAAGLEDTARRQKEAAAWLLGQRSRLDLLELQLQRERKELEQKAAQLGKMAADMREAQARLKKQQDYFKDASSSWNSCSRTWVDATDPTALRLWDVLMGQDQSVQQFRSYKALAARCSQLVQDQRALEAQLAAPTSQLPALESSTEQLYRLLYNSSNQLQLSSPEMTELMQQLTTMQDDLYQKLAELLSELAARRRALESPLLRAQRSLYVYFYCNEDRLREVVEELEKQVSASSTDGAAQ